MRINRVKKCIGLGILLVMTGCSAEVSTEPESSTQEKVQIEAKIEETQSVQDEQQEMESPVQIVEEENNLAAGLDSEDDDFFVQCLQNLNQGNNITYADGYYYFRSQTVLIFKPLISYVSLDAYAVVIIVKIIWVG